MIDDNIRKGIELAEKFNLDLSFEGFFIFKNKNVILKSSILPSKDLLEKLSKLEDKVEIKLTGDYFEVLWNGKRLKILKPQDFLSNNLYEIVEIIKVMKTKEVEFNGDRIEIIKLIDNYFNSNKLIIESSQDNVIRFNNVKVKDCNEEKLILISMYFSEIIHDVEIYDCEYYSPILHLIITTGGVFYRDKASFLCHQVINPSLNLLKYMLTKNLRNCYIIKSNLIDEEIINKIEEYEKKYSNSSIII